jgi:hypothetical protein
MADNLTGTKDNDLHRRTWSDARDPPRSPPRVNYPPIPKGQDYFSLTAKHGKPIGPFDKDRQLPYKAVK